MITKIRSDLINIGSTFVLKAFWNYSVQSRVFCQITSFSFLLNNSKSKYSTIQNCSSSCRHPIEEIIFSNNVTFWYRLDSPQLKWDLVSSIILFIYELSQEFLNEKLENIRKVLKLGVETEVRAQSSVGRSSDKFSVEK